jgi:hypothetical protein
MCQLLRGPRAQQLAANLPRATSTSSKETTVDSTTPAPPSNPDEWHDIDNFLKTLRWQLAKQEPSTSNPTHPCTSSSSCASSKPLHNHIDISDHCIIHARSKATMSHPIHPYSQPLDYLPINRSTVDKYKLVLSALNLNIFDKDREQQENEDYNNIKDSI